MILNLFAGPGGWCEGLRQLGLQQDIIGIEIDGDACSTRAAAGHRTIRADVSTYPTERFAGKVEGLIISPPCPDWSQAGRGAGRDGETGGLVDEVPRWVAAVRPRWLACEQVPPALPVWQDFARLLSTWGYSTWAGVLEAERFGVAQTRERAILIASLDRPALPPTPTHQRYVPGVAQGAGDECQASLLGPGLVPWVSMADALGWGFDESPARTVCGDRSPRWCYPDPDGTRGRVLHTGGQWYWSRPATTVCGDPRLGAPGHRDREGGEPQFGADAVRLTIEEALVLQSFPADYPLHGTKTSAFRQVGNAVPPLLAAAVIRSISGR